jgi:hypothetical protein
MNQTQIILLVKAIRKDVSKAALLALMFSGALFYKLLTNPNFDSDPKTILLIKLAPYIVSGLLLLGLLVGLLRARAQGLLSKNKSE